MRLRLHDDNAMPTLKTLSIALGLLSSDHAPIADAEGWQNYVWRVRPATECLSQTNGFCEIVRDDWDWKRPQHYRFAFRTDESSNTIISRVTLDNQDSSDTDNVCIVASFLNTDGDEIGILFLNWHSIHGRSYTRDAPIHPLAPVTEIATVAVGSKQCEIKAKSDAANFYRIRSQLGQR